MKRKQFYRKLIHNIRVLGALIFGIKKPRMARLMDSVIFELRLLIIMIFVVMGFFIFNTIIEDPLQSDIIRLTLKFNITVLIVILFLILRVLFKFRNANTRCDLPSKSKFTCENKFGPNKRDNHDGD